MVRIDKWLWSARFFKTRGLAKKAIDAGHIKINDQKTKPSRSININDEINIKKSDLIWNIKIVKLLDKRVSAKLAREAYSEEEKYQIMRASLIDENKMIYKSAPKPSKNPDKKARRALIKIKKSQS